MPENSKWTARVGVAAVVAAAIAGYALLRLGEAPATVRHAPLAVEPAPAADAPHGQPENAQQPRAAGPVAVASLPAARAEAPLDERLLMSTLRELGDSAPQYSLAMARDGNARFPDSADAAERAWYVCKSLVNLENFYDAREEARLMVARYPGTPWAADVARHLLVNPLDLPGDPAP